MRKKAIVIGLVSILILTSMLTLVNAKPTIDEKDIAVGAGVFTMEPTPGDIHKHFFSFSVSEKTATDIKGKFHLVCVHDKITCIIIKSDQISTLTVIPFNDGWQAIFTGTAMVKLEDMNWENGWQLTVTARDLDGKGEDFIMVQVSNGIEQHMMQGTLIAGNIIIKN